MPHVLVVDDDASIRDLVTRLFIGMAEVTAVGSGLEALQKLKNTRFDLIVIDLHMPLCDGFHTIQIAKGRAGPSRTTKVVVVTADTTDESRAKAMRLGAVMVVSKPFRIGALRIAAAGLLGHDLPPCPHPTESAKELAVA